MMQIIAVVAQKGGVGKTTTACHVAAACARGGEKVLLVDLDPQANATALLAPRLRPSAGTSEVLDPEVCAAIADVAIPTESGVDLCAGAPTLESIGLKLLCSEAGRELVLREALAGAAKTGRWTLCLIDCPPSLGLLTVNALVAADALVSPTTAAFLSCLAVQNLEATVLKVRQRLNAELLHLGYLLCAVDERKSVTAASREVLREVAKGQLWKSEVRVDTNLEHAPEVRQRRSRGIEDYEAVARELRRRLKRASDRTSDRTLKKASG